MSDRDMEQIYKDYAQMVYRYLRSLTYDSELAEELTQETFYRAVHSIHRFDGSSKLSTWLCQIAKHTWLKELEKRKKRSTKELDDQIPAPASLEDSLVFSDEKTRLYRAIHKLEEPMKEVVLLRLTGELSFSEIGDVMNRNEGWARTTFYRAKKKLMEVLKDANL